MGGLIVKRGMKFFKSDVPCVTGTCAECKGSLRFEIKEIVDKLHKMGYGLDNPIINPNDVAKFTEVRCPHCGHDFGYDKAKVLNQALIVDSVNKK